MLGVVPDRFRGPTTNGLEGDPWRGGRAFGEPGQFEDASSTGGNFGNIGGRLGASDHGNNGRERMGRHRHRR